MQQRPEFLIGATRSGSGKTLLTLGILAALNRRGLAIQPFKCGPDFIDPSLHQLVVSRASINLDLHMMGKSGCSAAHQNFSHGAEAVVIEGVMGLFDGGEASSAALAMHLDVPVLLIVDVRSAAESVAAVIQGFEIHNPKVKICGVICNRVGSDRHRQLIEEAVQASCKTEILGFFPRSEAFEMPSRHLGLHMGHELAFETAHFDTLAAAVEKHIRLDRLIELSGKQVSATKPPVIEDSQLPIVRLAVARDEAFCFYYPENFDHLRCCGFEIIHFSPLHDNDLPAGIDGIYLGGGYPELYAKELSDNSSMRQAIYEWAAKGRFIYGECGGFMYLTRELIDKVDTAHPMTGVFPVTVKMKNRLSRLGYRSGTLIDNCIMGEKGRQVFGHEFHYSDIVDRPDEIAYLYQLSDGRMEGCQVMSVYGSYIHLHFARTRENLQHMHSALIKNRQEPDL